MAFKHSFNGYYFYDKSELAQGVVEYWLSDNGKYDIEDIILYLDETQQDFDSIIEMIDSEVDYPEVLDTDDIKNALEVYYDRINSGDNENDELLYDIYD